MCFSNAFKFRCQWFGDCSSKVHIIVISITIHIDIDISRDIRIIVVRVVITIAININVIKVIINITNSTISSKLLRCPKPNDRYN